MDSAALFKVQYGLFLISTREGDRDNACISNVLAQVASSPLRVSLAISKRNFTCELIERTGRFNASTLTVEAPFSLYERFGFQSGRDVDKFAGLETVRAANGLTYEPRYANAYLSCKVVESLDLGSHRLFVAEVEDAAVLSKVESATYEYYRSHVKPKPAAPASGVKGWRCTVCGYIHASEDLPSDFVCPVCKHGAVDFVKIESDDAASTPETNETTEGNETSANAWRCSVCGYLHNGERPSGDFVCPVCGVGAEKFERVD
ncbi:MAG: flavin reductase [Thermoguttaceae bacterium]|nr:flavin reductase [Thermoguttaceae bacterium]